MIYSTPKVGIDDMAVYVPQLYLPIQSLATARQLEFDKLHKGLGLTAMAMPDLHEDVATMAANAVLELFVKNDFAPSQIGRLYVGSESALDGSKPIATYVLEMLTRYFENQHGPDCFLHCDVVDLTFACIGAVDALQNTLDWAKGVPDRMGIVVSTDFAKYELGSGGEYTQGAGAVALLVTQQPRLLAISDAWGVATVGVHDFFKPIRQIKRSDVVNEAFALLNLEPLNTPLEASKIQSAPAQSAFDSTDEWIQIHRDTPIFDGQFSNQCYQERIRQAYHHFVKTAFGHLNGHAGPVLSGHWSRLVFHLPYAYHARRIFTEIYLEEALKSNKKAQIEQETSAPIPTDGRLDHYWKLVAKTPSYQAFVKDFIERGERGSSLVGNMYTGSIFLGLISTLEADWQEGNDLNGKQLGFFAYGSGSKAKVFEGILQPQWTEVVCRFEWSKKLDSRVEISYETYELLHRGKLEKSVAVPNGVFILKSISDDVLLPGVRSYGWKEKVTVEEVVLPTHSFK